MPSILWFFAGALTAQLLYWLAKGTMNQFQWFPWWGRFPFRIYWITRSHVVRVGFPVSIGHQYVLLEEDLDNQATFVGRGVSFRLRSYSFQCGLGRIVRSSPVLYRELNVPVDEIQKGTAGVWEPQDAT